MVAYLWSYGVQMSHQVLAESACANRRNWWEMRHSDGTACRQDVPPRADAVGLGTIFMETIGCVQQRVCHLGGCTVGVATQRKDLMRVSGESRSYGLKFLLFFAREIREHLGRHGYRSAVRSSGVPICCNEGRQDLPNTMGGFTFDDLLQQAAACGRTDLSPFSVNPLNQRLLQDAAPALDPTPSTGGVSYEIRNHRSRLRCTLAGELALRKEREGQRFRSRFTSRACRPMGSALAFHMAWQISWRGLPTMRWATRWRTVVDCRPTAR